MFTDAVYSNHSLQMFVHLNCVFGAVCELAAMNEPVLFFFSISIEIISKAFQKHQAGGEKGGDIRWMG